jgi:hypothetical protein
VNIYLAGPMRGRDDFNFPAFHAAAAKLRAQGHEVLNPAETDHNSGFDPAGMKGTNAELEHAAFDLRAALAFDLTWICTNAETVAVLPNWQRSLGARAEVAAAHAIGIPVFEVDEVPDATA